MTGHVTKPSEDDCGAHGPAARRDPGPGWWREILDHSPDGLVLVQDDRVVFANTALAQMVGRTRSDLHGALLADLIPKEHRAWHARMLEVTSGEPQPREMVGGMVVHLSRADESEVPVEIALARLVLDGRPTTLATVRDVTACRAGEAERARLAQLLDLVPDGMILVDTRTRTVVDANQAATELLGYAGDELRGMPVRRLAAAGETAEGYVSASEVLVTDGSDLHLQRLVTRAGSVVDCEVHASVVEDLDHGLLLVNVVRDIGERLALEQRLRESEESFRTTFEQAPVGIALLARDERDGGPLRFVRTNCALDRMLGYSAGELVGADIAILRTPEDRQATAVQRAHGGKERSERTVIRRYRRKDGSTLWAEVRVSMLDLPVSRESFLVHAVDVSTRIAAERSLRRDSIVNRFVADVARAALEAQPEDGILTLLAAGVAEAVEAEGVAVLLVADGDGSSGIWSGAAGPCAVDLIDRIDEAGREGLIAKAARYDGSAEEWPLPSRPGEPDLGPVTLVPLGEGVSGPHGVVAVCRGTDAQLLSDEDDQRVTRLVTQAQVALRLARARADQARLAVLEERQRIARDLHDTVIQDVIAVGMQITADVDVESDPRRQVRDLEKVAQLEAAARNLRRAVFELRAAVGRTSTAAEVTELVSEASKVLGHFPVLTIVGPVDDLAPDLVDDLIASLREALSNIARHARASTSSVSLAVDPSSVTLVVEDDGVGAQQSAGGSYGVGNLHERARRHGGHAQIGARPGEGTRVVWTCPRDGAVDEP